MTKGEVFETVLLFLAIGSLWPLILGWQSLWAKAIPVAFIPVLIWMARRRFQRFRQALTEAGERSKKSP